MTKILKRLPVLQTALAIFFLLVQTGCALYLPYLTAGIVNNGIAANDINFILRQGALMLLFSLLSLGGALLNMYTAGRISFNIGKNLREELFQKVLSFSKTEYNKFGTSSLITRSTNDVTQAQTLVDMFLKFLILSPLYLIGGIFMTWRLSPSLAMVFVYAIPFMAAAAVIIYLFATPLYVKIQKTLDSLNLYFREGLTGVRVIRAFNKEKSDYEKYELVNRNHTNMSITAGTIMSVFVPLITFLMSLATIGIVYLSGNGAATGTMEVGAIMAAISYSAQILVGFSLLTNVILSLPKGKVSVNRIFEVLETPLSIEEGDKMLFKRHNSLKFRNVDFSYPNAMKKTLENISFSVIPGETLAVTGSTGDGKTTLLNLITRSYDVDGGSIHIGGMDIRQLTDEEISRQVSICPQKSALFTGTIRSNLLLAKPQAKEAELWAVLDTACAAEFVKSLPGGLDSAVKKGGSNFSGGQRQRLCIARTLLKDADIYLFDDSFSALDFKTDKAVRTAIKNLLKDKIIIIVGQRMGSIADSDKVLLLERGKLAGLGTHQTLLATNPVYQEIAKSQDYKEAAA